MVAKEFYLDQEAGNEETTLLQDPYEEEEEETLSLSDLPIYSDSISSRWGDFSKEDGQNTQSYNNNDDDEDDDFFEFFSEEFTTSTRATADNIIFCGKLIPFKDPPHVPVKGKNLESKTNTTKRINSEKGALLPWRSNSFDKAKPSSKDVTVTSCDDATSFKKGQEAKGSKSFARDYSSVGKVSLLRSTTKSRWFLFMFGMPRLSTEMELRDIRNRQVRRSSAATMFPAPEQGEELKIKGRRNCKRWWKVLRSIHLGLGCRSSSKLANDVVKAAFV